MSELIYVKPIPHHCNPGADLEEGTYTVGSIARCECGRFFRALLIDYWYTSGIGWNRVRWWNFKERKIIRQYWSETSVDLNKKDGNT